MSDEHVPADWPDRGESFVLDETVSDEAVESVLTRDGSEISTKPRTTVKSEIMEDVREYFTSESDPTELGIAEPDDTSVQQR